MCIRDRSWIMTLLLNKTISLLFLIVIPLLGGTLIYIAKKAHPHFIKVFDEYDVLNNSVQENVNASRVVKAFVREDYEIDKFHDISKYVYNLFTKAEKIVAWNSPVMQFTMYSVVLIMVLIGGKSIIAGTMETGELTSVIVYALQIIGSLMMVTFVFVMIMIAEASSDRITEVMNEIQMCIRDRLCIYKTSSRTHTFYRNKNDSAYDSYCWRCCNPVPNQ